jgi:hypothetical protein
MKVNKVELRIIDLSDILQVVGEDKVEFLEKKFSWGDCLYSLVELEEVFEAFPRDLADGLWDALYAANGDELRADNIAVDLNA